MCRPWADAAAGTADVYAVVPLEVRSSGGQTVVTPLRTIFTTGHSVTLDALVVDGANAIEVVAEQGIHPGMIRLATGIEDTDDLIDDVEKALEALL